MEMTRDEHTTGLAAKNAGGRVGREKGKRRPSPWKLKKLRRCH